MQLSLLSYLIILDCLVNSTATLRKKYFLVLSLILYMYVCYLVAKNTQLNVKNCRQLQKTL